MSNWSRLLGFRNDIDLNELWWHRLAKVLYFLWAFLFGGLLFLSGWEGRDTGAASYKDIDIKTDLDTFLAKSDDSVANVIPAFLSSTGRIGIRNNADRKVESTYEYYLDNSWCTPNVFRHLSATADFLNRRDSTTANTAKSVLASIQKVRADLPDPRNARYCWLHTSLQGTDISDIVKYEFSIVGYYRTLIIHMAPVIFWFLVANVVVLNLYYRGFVYIICGPRSVVSQASVEDSPRFNP
jgi:hypothetical protein